MSASTALVVYRAPSLARNTHNIDGAVPGLTREYRTFDKSQWGAGAWHTEPDKIQWIDEATDQDCLIVRGLSGALCAYVGVKPSHPWHGKGYAQCTLPIACGESWCNHSVGSLVGVHGGVTFTNKCQDVDDECEGVCHRPVAGREDHVWWIGFDCAHYNDVSPGYAALMSRELGGPSMFGDGEYRDVAYVVAQVRTLAEQLIEVPFAEVTQ